MKISIYLDESYNCVYATCKTSKKFIRALNTFAIPRSNKAYIIEIGTLCYTSDYVRFNIYHNKIIIYSSNCKLEDSDKHICTYKLSSFSENNLNKFFHKFADLTKLYVL